MTVPTVNATPLSFGRRHTADTSATLASGTSSDELRSFTSALATLAPSESNVGPHHGSFTLTTTAGAAGEGDAVYPRDCEPE